MSDATTPAVDSVAAELRAAGLVEIDCSTGAHVGARWLGLEWRKRSVENMLANYVERVGSPAPGFYVRGPLAFLGPVGGGLNGQVPAQGDCG